MLLDLEKFRQSVIQKLEARNLDLDENDFMMLNIDSDLKNQFFDVLRADISLFTPSLVSLIERLDDYEAVLIDDTKLLVAYGKASILTGDYSVVSAIKEYVSEEEAKDVLNYFLELIDNDSISKKSGYLSDELIEIILEKEKYDFFNHITGCSELSESTLAKMREYAKTVDLVPDFLASQYDKLKIDYSKYSASALLKIFNKVTGNDDYFWDGESIKGDEAEVQQIYQLIVDKLRAGESFDPIFFKDNFTSVFINYDKSNKRELIEILINSIGLNSTIINTIDSDFSEYEDLVIEHITPQSDLGASFFYINNFINSPKVIEKLIECGLIEDAVQSSLFNDYVPILIDKIKSGDPVYQNVVVEHAGKFKNHLELLQLLLEKDMIKSLSFEFNELLNSKGLKEFVLSEIRNGRNMTLSESCYSIEGILDTVIQSRNFVTLQKTNLNQLEHANLSEESINVLIEALKANISLADKILLSSRSLIFQNKPLLNFYLQSNGYFIEKVIDRINHEETLEYLYNEETYNLVKGYYAEKYALNVQHLELMSAKFGPKIIRYLDNDNIHQLVNLTDEEFNMFMALFSDEKIKMSDLANIYDSVMQYKFAKEHTEVVNIFADIMHSLDDKNNIYVKKLEELYSILGDKFYGKFAENYPGLVGEFKNDPKQFLLNIVNQIQNNPEQSDKYTEVLHFITNYYIAVKREEYRDKCNMYEESSLNLPYGLDENDLEKKLVETCLRDTYHKSVIRLKMVQHGLDVELANKCILYFLSKKDKTSKEKDIEVRILDGTKIIFSLDEIKQIKPHLRELSLFSKEYVKGMSYRESYISQLDQQGLVERVYRTPDNIPDIYQLLSGMNASALKHTLSHPEAYQSLLQTMHKYKIHFLPEGFKPLLESEHIGIAGDYSNLSGFISYYDKIYEAEKSRLESQGKSADTISLKPVNIFIYGEVYSSVSSVYSQVLSSKDASLIKANPGPNSASRKTAGNTRLNEAIERTINNFTRMAVTIPTFAENVSLESGKAMHVVVGNFTNPSNMTHGERTGACMRIGGVGETLFQFCLDNENGFHIRFENPMTGEYISRVSGFRNGNTVFLNELRNSCNSEDYSDEEVVEACRRVAELLIEKSKNSTCPIENIVVHTAYAVDSTKYPKTDLGVASIKTGLPGFYSDVSSSAHILATSSTTSKFVPLDFDKSQVPTYLPAREKAKESTNLKDLIDMINRVAGVKALLAGQPLESIEPVIVDDSFIYGIASQDWYIYIDGNLEVHEDIIHLDERAKEELAVARKRVEEMLPVVEKQQAYSY